MKYFLINLASHITKNKQTCVTFTLQIWPFFYLDKQKSAYKLQPTKLNKITPFTSGKTTTTK